MRRIVILGPPGSGKSTLARALGARHGLPVFHLDQFFWQPGWVMTPTDRFAAAVTEAAARPDWVIEGNYIRTLPPRLARADTAVFLDVPTRTALWRVCRRLLASYGRVRPDSAPGCPERIDLAFLRFTAAWNTRNRPALLAALEAFPGRRLVLSPPQARLALRRADLGAGTGRSAPG